MCTHYLFFTELSREIAEETKENLNLFVLAGGWLKREPEGSNLNSTYKG